MRTVPLTLEQANAMVAKLHRHHKPVRGHRFSMGAMSGSLVVGASIVGRPVARKTEQYNIAEVVRMVTDGKKNSCSRADDRRLRKGRDERRDSELEWGFDPR